MINSDNVRKKIIVKKKRITGKVNINGCHETTTAITENQPLQQTVS